VSLVVLLILAGVWALFLVPQVLRARAARPADSIGAFSRQLSVLGRTGTLASSPHPPLFPMDVGDGSSRRSFGQPLTAAEARRRRRDVFRALLIGMGVTLLLGLLPPLRRLLLVHLLLDGLFVAYVALLYRAQAAAAERHAKVRRLHIRAHPAAGGRLRAG